MIPHIKTILKEFTSPLLQHFEEELDPLTDLFELIDQSILDDPPVSVRDGGMIKDGFSEEADRLRHAKTEGKTWLAELEAKEKEKSGIKTLKVKFNKVFGYYLSLIHIWTVPGKDHAGVPGGGQDWL